MTLPQPKRFEKYQNFMKRFLKNSDARKKFPEIKQRFAVGSSIWSKYN